MALRELLEQADLSQTVVAAQLGVTQAAVNQWVNGRRTPGLMMASRLAAILRDRNVDVTAEDLFPVTEESAPIESPVADLPAAPPAPGVACDALPQPGDARAACPACGAAVEAGR
jgi:transcriptional regulator with XRE-family HTH domain